VCDGFYSTTAGSFIETSLSTESGNPNLFIINQTRLQYTTDGSLIQSIRLARSINRNQFLINKSLSDQRPPVRLINARHTHIETETLRKAINKLAPILE
jgi:hypothetical protein